MRNAAGCIGGFQGDRIRQILHLDRIAIAAGLYSGVMKPSF